MVIFEKVLGKDHPSTATTYNNIALVYHDQGEYEEALEYYVKSFRVMRIRLGKAHVNTKKVFKNMQCAFVDSGRIKTEFEQWLKVKL